MGFGSLSGAQIRLVMTELKLVGKNAYVAGMTAASLSTRELAIANATLAANTKVATRASFLQNQVRFTGRRLLFYATLGTLALGAAVVKLGFSYANTMQQAQVALRPMFSDTASLNREMNKLFSIAALTPFQFKDIVTGFTQMLKAGTESVPKINATVQAISDILSSIPGKGTASNLNRVTTAINHMLNLGHVTGQMRLQLARLGIPLDYILKHTLGATDDQLQNIASSGITATQVLDALIKASKTMPRFMNQAQLSQLNTFSGVMSTFKDFLSQAAAGGVEGPFTGLFKLFKSVDKALGARGLAGLNTSLTDIADIFDKKLTPKTHIIINLFIMFTYFIKTVVGALKLLLGTISILLTPLDLLGNAFGGNRVAAKLLGFTLGVLTAIWLAAAGSALLYALAVDVANFSMLVTKGILKVLIGTRGLLGLNIALKGAAASEVLFALSNTTAGVALGLFFLQVKEYGIIYALIMAINGLTASFIGLDIALGPLILITVLVIGLGVAFTLLYLKWKKFHDFINRNWMWLTLVAGPIIAPMIIATQVVTKFYNLVMKLYRLLKNAFTLNFDIKIHKPSWGGWLGIVKKAVSVEMQVLDPAGIQRGIIHKTTGVNVDSLLSGTKAEKSALPAPTILKTPANTQVTRVSDFGKFQFPKELNLKTVLNVDGKQIAEAVAKHRLDTQARR